MSELPQADRFGPVDDHPYWNESVWFSFTIPELRQHGFIQYYFRPNMNMLNGGPAMWDASGTNIWNCLYFNWSNLQAMPEGAEKFNMTANNSLSVKVLDPLKRYSIRYDNEDFKLDLEWNAIAPMHVLKSKDPAQQWAQKFHMEQAGKLTGTLCRDGHEMASLESGVRRVEQYGKYDPNQVIFEAKDQLGRELRATGTIDEGLKFTGYTDRTSVWPLRGRAAILLSITFWCRIRRSCRIVSGV